MRVVIIDDDRFVCLSLRTILQAAPDIEVCATGSSGEEAIRLFDRLTPDVLLMDIQMSGIGGLEAGEEILRRHPDARILYLTTFSDNEYIIRALRLGASGYLIKQDIDTILPALRAVMQGQSVFGGSIRGKLPDLMTRNPSFHAEQFPLSERESEVIELVAKGMNNREIAEALFLSEGTVRNYLTVILDKLGLRDRTQLAVFYYQHRS